MTSYSIILPNDKANSYKVVTYVTALINLFFFGYLMFFMGLSENRTIFSIGFFLSILSLICFWLMNSGMGLRPFRMEIYFIVCGLIWVISGKYGLGILLVLFASMGFVINKLLRVLFSEDGIRYPSFPEKTFAWSEVDFVLLKDGILSIELKENKLLQFTLESHQAAKVDEQAFNAFCASLVKG